MIIHVVTQGETLTSIASLYGVTAESIIQNNQLKSPGQLVAGQTLVILIPRTVYTVKPGDSLFSIAEQFGVNVITLLQNNPRLRGNFDINSGEEIVIEYEVNKEKTLETNGYAYSFVDRDLLKSVLPYLTRLTIFGYGFTETGDLIPAADDEEIIALAYQYEAIPILLLSSITESGTFSSETASKVFNNVEAQYNLIGNLISVMYEKGYLGIDIDFEFIDPEDRQNYIDFVDRVTKSMNSNGFSVNVDLAPKTSKTQAGLLYESHDYGALSNAANTVLLMTYEWGYTYGPPLAVAPVPQVRRVIEYALSEIPDYKIFMGIPNYAYDWPLPYERGITKAETIGNEQAIDIARKYGVSIQYDKESEAPYFFYYDSDGIEHVVWFEDARSIMAKLGLIDEYMLLGPGYWNLMRQFTQNWLVINSMFYIRKRL